MGDDLSGVKGSVCWTFVLKDVWLPSFDGLSFMCLGISLVLLDAIL